MGRAAARQPRPPKQAPLVPVPMLEARAVIAEPVACAPVDRDPDAPFTDGSPEATFSLADLRDRLPSASQLRAAAARRSGEGEQVLVAHDEDDGVHLTDGGAVTTAMPVHAFEAARIDRLRRRVASRYPNALVQR